MYCVFHHVYIYVSVLQSVCPISRSSLIFLSCDEGGVFQSAVINLSRLEFGVSVSYYISGVYICFEFSHTKKKTKTRWRSRRHCSSIETNSVNESRCVDTHSSTFTVGRKDGKLWTITIFHRQESWLYDTRNRNTTNSFWNTWKSYRRICTAFKDTSHHIYLYQRIKITRYPIRAESERSR